MTQAPTKFDQYLADYQVVSERISSNGADWAQTLRADAMESFKSLGFPTARKGNEKWKYTNVGPLAAEAFSYSLNGRATGVTLDEVKRVAPWNDSWINLVFVDGTYSEEFSSGPNSNGGLVVKNLAEAMASNSETVQRHLAQYATFEDDGFTALNTAFVQDGAFIEIPEGATIDTPIHLLFVSSGNEHPTVTYPRILAVAGKGSKATILESYIGLSQDRYFTNSVFELVLEDGADVTHVRLLAESDDAYHIGVARVHLAQESKFYSSAFYKSVRLGRYDLYTLLNGDGCECHLNGLYSTSGRQHVDNYINIDHAKPNGTSRLLYKGILAGKSRAIFGGTVWVREGAMKTDAMQSDKNLVLSPDAEIDTKPALYIWADDVKCGHGATAGNIDMDTVFYMRSRGLDLETASRLLIYGFAAEVLERVSVEEYRTHLEELFLSSLPTYKFEF